MRRGEATQIFREMEPPPFPMDSAARSREAGAVSRPWPRAADDFSPGGTRRFSHATVWFFPKGFPFTFQQRIATERPWASSFSMAANTDTTSLPFFTEAGP